MTFQHWAGVSPYTSSYDFAETCVFVKQLLGPLFCDRIAAVPLLPKLRGHFAEFLNNASLVRLRIFSSSTCVGLRYGLYSKFSNFSRQREFINFVTIFTPHHDLALTCVLNNMSASSLVRTIPSMRLDYPSVSLLHLLSYKYRNIYLLSIIYASQPRLRSRLTLGGQAFPRKP